MSTILVFYCLSGFISLGYQICWFRILVDRFGSTNLTFALVLINFIGGIGIGSFASRRVTSWLSRYPRLNHPIRQYGAIEFLLAASAALTLAAALIPADFAGAFPYALRDGIYHQTLIYQAGKYMIATVILFIPCFFMGLTFPLLCRCFPEDERFPSRLYAWNTLGACLGIAAQEFIFLPTAGHDFSFAAMLGLNGVLAVFCFTSADRILPGARDVQLSNNIEPASANQQDTAAFSVLFLLAIISGFLSGALEGDAFRRIRLTSFRHAAVMSFISFWAILAIYSASWAVHRLRSNRLGQIKFCFLASLLLYFGLFQFVFEIRNAMGMVSAHTGEMAAQFLFAGLLVFPAYFLISLMLPAICNRYQQAGRHLGWAYGANTIAFCAGMIAFTWIAPRVNIFYSLKLMMGVFATLAVLAACLDLARPLRARGPLIALAILLLAVFMTPRGFDKNFYRPDTAPAKYPVHSMRSNGANTIFIVDDPEGARLYFEGYSMSAIHPAAQSYMRMMAHFPLLAQREPASALLICFGVGNTASAIANHPSIKRIDVVDLNDKVFEMAPEFKAANREVYRDSRVSLIHDDGRNFLHLTDRQYDLITSEPPPPMQEGIYRLYSVEYYQSALEHLTPQGMMTQWLPIEQMPAEAVDLAISSFVSVFPENLIYVGWGTNLILLGAKSRVALEYIEANFRIQPGTLSDLSEQYASSAVQLLARIAKSDAELKKEYGGRAAISDKRNDMDYLAFSLASPLIRYNPAALAAAISGLSPETSATIHATWANMARLRTAVQDFPAELLVTAAPLEIEGIKFASADWKRIDALTAGGLIAERGGDQAKAIEAFAKSLALVPEQLTVLGELARAEEAAGELAAALETWKRYQAIQIDGRWPGALPDLGHFDMGLVYAKMKNAEEALGCFQRSARLDPSNPNVHKMMGDFYAAKGDYASSLAAYDQALKIAPGFAEAAQARALAEAQMRKAPN